MNPRNLRHRLEKAAKLLVVVQKHVPDVDCVMNEDKGENGHLIIDFSSIGADFGKMQALGKDLEGKGYTFVEKRKPWLGNINYTGRSEGKTTIVLTVPINKDRLSIDEDNPETAYSFKDSN